MYSALKTLLEKCPHVKFVNVLGIVNEHVKQG
jgi:phage FluMu protein Com